MNHTLGTVVNQISSLKSVQESDEHLQSSGNPHSEQPTNLIDFINNFYSELKEELSLSRNYDIHCLRRILDRYFLLNPLPKCLTNIRAIFSLDLEECIILFLCASIEVNSNYAELYSLFSNNNTFDCLNPHFFSTLFNTPYSKYFSSQSPLIKELLILPSKSVNRLLAQLKIAENVLHYLLNTPFIDSKILSISKYVDPSLKDEEIHSSHSDSYQRLLNYLSLKPDKRPTLLQITGNDLTSTESMILSACHLLHKPIYFIDGMLLPDEPHEIYSFVLFLSTEAKLSNSIYVVDLSRSQGDANHEKKYRLFISHALKYLSCRCILTTNEGITQNEHLLSITVNKPLLSEIRRYWENLLAISDIDMSDDIGCLVEQFDLSKHQIKVVCSRFHARFPELNTSAKILDLLWELCREVSRVNLPSLGQRLEARLTWNDIALSLEQKEVLEHIVIQVGQRYKVYRKWGMADRESRGLGIVSLFCGASGTGKTLAAEVLANELNLDIYQINLSKIVSKYIGETQKNLEELFNGAEKSSAILLFDEADALFSKRSQVKESRDRYSNMEIDYLLQRLENYKGLSILTTNLKSNIDTAFLRRFRFVLEFHYPTIEERKAIWKNMLTESIPKERIDIQQLSELPLTGANIRNVVLNAAFYAASNNVPMRMSHLKQALSLEYKKLEKSLPDSINFNIEH